MGFLRSIVCMVYSEHWVWLCRGSIVTIKSCSVCARPSPFHCHILTIGISGRGWRWDPVFKLISFSRLLTVVHYCIEIVPNLHRVSGRWDEDFRFPSHTTTLFSVGFGISSWSVLGFIKIVVILKCELAKLTPTSVKILLPANAGGSGEKNKKMFIGQQPPAR